MNRWKTGIPMLALLIGCSLTVAAAVKVPDNDVRVTPTVLAVRKARDCVVNIYSDIKGVDYVRTFFFGVERRPVLTTSLGSGVIISEDGYIVTNYHVVTGAAGEQRSRDIKVKVRMRDGHELEARVIGLDTANDLAVLKIDADWPLPAAQLGRSDDLMIGETVIAMGNPYGYENSVTQGIISGTQKTLTTPAGQEFRDFIQTDASLNFGNSGGPLFNIKGELIGINQLIAADPQRGMRAESIGLAIPIDRVREALIEALLNPAVVKGTDTGFELAEEEGRLPIVKSVFSDGPAAKAGLRRGDRILSVDGSAVRDALDVNRLLLARSPGDTISLRIARGSDESSLRWSLERAEAREFDVLWSRIGVQAVDHNRYSGALVRAVRPDSPAATIGLRPNDLVRTVNGRPIRYTRDLEAIVRPLPAGTRLEIELVRLTTNDLMGGPITLE
ncbi:MAG: trypsin-like peptidase domain-containing protein [Planctomycetota bacterium]